MNSGKSNSPTVWVIDDDAGVRASLLALLSSAGWLAEVFESAEGFLAAGPRWMAKSGCVFTDVRMPGMDGLALTAHLKASVSAPPVIVMTGHGDVALAVKALKSGAFDFIEKPFEDRALLAVIEAAVGERTITETVPPSGRFVSAAQRVARLSPRERDVLALLAEGKPNKIIAHELGLSPRTVEIHRARMMEHLCVGSFAEALRVAVLAELAEDDGISG